MLNYRTITALGLLLALLLHYGLTRALNLLPRHDSGAVREDTAQVTTVEAENGWYRWEVEMAAWAEIADPTLISLPQYALGFSIADTETVVKPEQPIPEYDPDRNLRAEGERREVEFPTRALTVASIGGPRLGVPKMAVESPPRPALPRIIMWRNADGNEVPQMPRRLPNGLAEVAAKKPPTEITQVEIVRLQDRVRVRLRQSCGNDILDRFAVRLVAKKAVAEEGQVALRNRKPDALLLPPKQDFMTIEVDWRLLAAPLPETAGGTETL